MAARKNFVITQTAVTATYIFFFVALNCSSTRTMSLKTFYVSG